MIIDMKERGFTIIELIIVIIIMGVLMTLGVVNLRSTQANARDSERKIDIETIALQLERYYESNDGKGTYPSTLINASLENMTGFLTEIDISNLRAPDSDSETDSFVAATNNTETTAGVLPQPTVIDQNQYVYQPIDSSGGLCEDAEECRRFNLYYMTEIDSTVHVVASRYQ